MTQISQAAITEFATTVTNKYSDSRKLAEAVESVTGATGAQYKFPVLSSSMAKARVGFGEDLVPNADAFGTVTATATDWYSTDYIESFEQMKVNFSLSENFSNRMAKAIGRRADQVIIDALIAAKADITNEVATDISGVVSNLTLDALIEAAGLLNDNGVDEEDRFFVCSSQGLRGLLKDDKLTSSDYAAVQALVNGTVDSFMGFKFITIAAGRGEGGLDLTTNVRTNYAFHKDAIGYVEFGAMDMTGAFSASKGVDVITAKLSAAAAVKDATGVVRVLSSEA